MNLTDEVSLLTRGTSVSGNNESGLGFEPLAFFMPLPLSGVTQRRRQLPPLRERISTFSTLPLSQLIDTSNPPRATRPVTLPFAHLSGSAGRMLMKPS